MYCYYYYHCGPKKHICTWSNGVGAQLLANWGIFFIFGYDGGCLSLQSSLPVVSGHCSKNIFALVSMVTVVETTLSLWECPLVDILKAVAFKQNQLCLTISGLIIEEDASCSIHGHLIIKLSCSHVLVPMSKMDLYLNEMGPTLGGLLFKFGLVAICGNRYHRSIKSL